MSPLDYFLEKILPALVQGAVTLGALFLGARFTRHAAERASIVQRDLSVEAEKRRAQREDEIDQRRERRAALSRLLEQQTAAYVAYLELCAKWLAHEPSPMHPRGTEKDNAEAYADGVLLTPKLQVAFGSEDFAHQVAAMVQGIFVMRSTPDDRFMIEQVCAHYAREMRACIDATAKELGIEVPRPPVLALPKAEFELAGKEARLRELFRGRVTDAQMKEGLRKLRELVTKRGAPGTFDFPSDEAPPNESGPSSSSGVESPRE